MPDYHDGGKRQGWIVTVVVMASMTTIATIATIATTAIISSVSTTMVVVVIEVWCDRNVGSKTESERKEEIDDNRRDHRYE